MSKSYTVKLPGKSPVTLTAGSFCAPCEAATLQAQTAAVQKSYQIDPGEAPSDAAWEGPLIFEGRFTGDGRFINKDALFWDASQLPMPLRYAPEDMGAHGGAQVIGLINSLERRDDGAVWGTGIIDTSTELGYRVYQGLQKGTIRGVSADLDDFELEVRLKQEIYEEMKASMEEFMAVMEGEEPEEKEEEEPEADENGYVKVGEYAADDEVAYMTSARIRAATLVDIPAFVEAYVALVDGEAAIEASAAPSVLVAGAPVNPPSSWFTANLDGPTPLTFTEDGRVFGHIALWGTCHTGYAGACVTPPFSRTNYSWFRTGALHTDDGQELAVGRIVMDTGHAGSSLSAAPAAAHYDDTGTAMADVAAGEDQYGIWVAGALRPGVTAEQLRALRSSPMSGDWRDVGGNLELVGVLAVNIPGFPVPRAKALVAGGRTSTLIRPVDGETVVEEQKKEPSKVEIFAAKALQVTVSKWAAEVGE